MAVCGIRYGEGTIGDDQSRNKGKEQRKRGTQGKQETRKRRREAGGRRGDVGERIRRDMLEAWTNPNKCSFLLFLLLLPLLLLLFIPVSPPSQPSHLHINHPGSWGREGERQQGTHNYNTHCFFNISMRRSILVKYDIHENFNINFPACLFLLYLAPGPYIVNAAANSQKTRRKDNETPQIRDEKRVLTSLEGQRDREGVRVRLKPLFKILPEKRNFVTCLARRFARCHRFWGRVAFFLSLQFHEKDK